MELVAHKLAVPASCKEVTVVPLGDIQWAGRKEHLAYNQLREFIAEAVERKAWFLGMGDYVDFMSPSNRKRLLHADLYDTAQGVVEDKARDLAQELYEDVLKPTRNRWLGMLEGHHWAHLESGETTDQYLCKQLGSRFLGTSAYVGLMFPTHFGTRGVTIWAHHGEGGGAGVAAPVNKLEGMANYWDADIMVIAHMSKKASGQIQRCYPVWNSKLPTVRYKTIHLVGAGAWLKGYAERSRHGNTPRGGYVEQRMMRPVALGSSFIKVTPKMRCDFKAHGRRTNKPERFWEPEIRVET